MIELIKGILIGITYAVCGLVMLLFVAEIGYDIFCWITEKINKCLRF